MGVPDTTRHEPRRPAPGPDAEMQSGLHVGLHRAVDRQEPQSSDLLAVAQRALAIHLPRHVERLQHGVIKPAGALEVADADRNVVKHVFLLYNYISGYMVRKTKRPCQPVNRLSSVDHEPTRPLP